MAEIVLQGVRKSYGATKVVHGVDWSIDDGEFVVIVGPSGCGKSTLLRMIAGLEVVTEGDISIGGRIVNRLEPAERDIAMVFQNYALYPHMSVFNNMAYGLKIKGIPKAEIEKRVQAAAKILELEQYLKRAPRQLSGGQRQRVAMGRAIVREPSVFLFDEPLSNLDAKLRVQMRLEIKKLQERLGITSVYVTHDQVEAMTLGHRLMVLNEGYVEQLGTPIELYEKPASRFVAGFLGSPSMNFLDGNLEDDGRLVRLNSGGTLRLDGAVAGAGGGSVVVGLRPEHFNIADGQSGMAFLIVSLVEHLGADSLVHGSFSPGGQDLTMRINGTSSIKPGDSLPIDVAAGNIHLFDSDSGKRLC